MKIFTHIFTIFCISLFFYPLHMHGMEKEKQTKTTSNHLLSLFEFPNDIFPLIQSLKDNIKFFLNARSTCKECNEVLTIEKVGDCCKGYSKEKNNLQEAILQSIQIKNVRVFNYMPKRPVVLLLLYLNGDKEKDKQAFRVPVTKMNERLFLEKAVLENDARVTEVIFKYYTLNAAVNILTNGPLCFKSEDLLRGQSVECLQSIPLLFAVKSVKMAKLFIAHGANVHATFEKNNILWHILDNSYPVSLMKFYLKRGVDAKKITSWKRGCLLHEFAKTKYSGGMQKLDNFMQKAKLLLETISDQVNLLNQYLHTTLDIAEQSLIIAKKSQDRAARVAFKALIILFQEYRGLTGKELKVQEKEEYSWF